MSSSDAPGDTPRAGRTRTWTIVCILLWSLAILAPFAMSKMSLVAPVEGLFVTVSLALASTWVMLGAGRRVMRSCRSFLPRLADPLERTVVELSIGVGLTMLLLFFMGALGLYNRSCTMALLIGLGIMSGDPRSLIRDLVSRARELSRQGAGAFLSFPILVGLMTFFQALTPATSQDALVYHLAVPEIYIREGGLVYVPGNFYASFPQNVEMLFTLALLVGDSALANWFHWLLGVGAAAGVAAVARRLAGGRGGLLAAAVFTTVPSVAVVSTWAYVDLGLVFFQMVAILAFLEWRRERRAVRASQDAPGSRTGEKHHLGWLVLAGVECGLAAGCKYTGGAIGLLLLLALLAEEVSSRRKLGEALTSTLAFCVATGALAAPWFVKNVLLTGNPLYPFLFGVFGGRDWDPQRAHVMSIYFDHFGGDSSPLGILLLPWRLTFSARFSSIENFDGIIGPVFLLALPLMLVAARRSPACRFVFLMTCGLTVLWVVMTRQIRFLIPALAGASVLVGAAIPLVLEGRPLRWSLRVLALALGLNVWLIGADFISNNPLPVVFGMESRTGFLTREIPCGDYPVFHYINSRLPGDAYVFMAASGNPGFLCKRRYYMDALFENHSLRRLIQEGDTPEGIHARFESRGFTHLLFRWDLVFDDDGTRSDLDRAEQRRLAAYLNRHARLEISHNGTFLYALETGSAAGPQTPSGGPGPAPSTETE